MNEAAARDELAVMTAADQDPTLDRRELDQCLSRARRPDRAGNLPTNVATAPTWTAATAYAAGDVIKGGNRWWICLSSGTSSAVAPGWPTTLTGPRHYAYRIVDNTVVWGDAGGEWAPTYLLEAGAAHGWRLKAAKVQSRTSFSADGATFQRREQFVNAMQMARMYERRVNGSVTARA